MAQSPAGIGAGVNELFRSDDTLDRFLDPYFDETAFTDAVVRAFTVQDTLKKLRVGIEFLDRELQSQVYSHHDDLLQQATSIQRLEGVVEMVRGRVESIQAAVERIRSRVAEPYAIIEAKTTQLARLQAACDVLRRVIRFLYLSRRLKGLMEGGSREAAKAAQTLSEIDSLLLEADISGVHAVDREARWIASARQQIEAEAVEMLLRGMETQNQPEVATSLQVFYNLGVLQQRVHLTLDGIESSLRKSIVAAFSLAGLQADSPAPPPSSGPGSVRSANQPPAGNTAAWRAAMWTRLEKLMDAIYAAAVQVHHLQRVLAKKRDPVTHVGFLDEIVKPGEPSISTAFWDRVTTNINEEMSRAADASPFFRQAFEGEFPKLLRQFGELWVRVAPLVVSQTPGAAPTPAQGSEGATGDESYEHSSLRRALRPFENGYLARSLSRLFDPVNLVFPAGARTPPSVDEVANIVRAMSSEMQAAAFDPLLMHAVARNVAKAVKLYTVKCENMLSSESDVTQVGGPCTAAQARNIGIANSLYHLHGAVSDAIAQHAEAQAEEIVRGSLEGLFKMVEAILDPLLASISTAVETVLLRMHSEDFSRSKGAHSARDEPDAPCSAYMSELVALVSHVQQEILARIDCESVVAPRLRTVAGRAMRLFVRHASLVRPLGEGGRLRLAADAAQMDLALSPLRPLGGVTLQDIPEHKMVRAFRPLLFVEPAQLLQTPAFGATVPPHVIAHLAIGRAPDELKAPHMRAGWSPLRYSEWLDTHSERDALLLVRAALDAYVQRVKQREGTAFAPVYPVLCEIVNQGLAFVGGGAANGSEEAAVSNGAARHALER
eukprot:Opistho-1_new@9359